MPYISENPFDFNFETTCYAISNYAMIGKALTFSTKFEKDAKAIANILKLRNSNIITNKASFTDFVEAIEQFQFFHEAIKQLKINRQIKDVLETAIKSRNFIAHDLTIGLENTSDDEISRECIIDALRPHIFALSEGEKFILLLNCQINKEPFPSLEFLNSFSQKIFTWVTDTEY